MGVPGGAVGTVVGAMPRRRLDRRTIGICVCVALVAALLAGLAATVVLGDDEPSQAQGDTGTATLTPAGEVDTDRLLTVTQLDLDDEPTSLGAYLGDTPLVVNFWASTCEPCITEMPLFEELHQERTDVDVVGINYADRLDKAKAMAAQTGITYPWIQDRAGDLGFEAKIDKLPGTLLVDTDGTVLATEVGEFDDRAELDAWVDAHLPD